MTDDPLPRTPIQRLRDQIEFMQIVIDDELAPLYCAKNGHRFVDDHCMKPEHKYCKTCYVKAVDCD